MLKKQWSRRIALMLTLVVLVGIFPLQGVFADPEDFYTFTGPSGLELQWDSVDSGFAADITIEYDNVDESTIVIDSLPASLVVGTPDISVPGELTYHISLPEANVDEIDATSFIKFTVEVWDENGDPYDPDPLYADVEVPITVNDPEAYVFETNVDEIALPLSDGVFKGEINLIWDKITNIQLSVEPSSLIAEFRSGTSDKRNIVIQLAQGDAVYLPGKITLTAKAQNREGNEIPLSIEVIVTADFGYLPEENFVTPAVVLRPNAGKTALEGYADVKDAWTLVSRSPSSLTIAADGSNQIKITAPISEQANLNNNPGNFIIRDGSNNEYTVRVQAVKPVTTGRQPYPGFDPGLETLTAEDYDANPVAYIPCGPSQDAYKIDLNTGNVTGIYATNAAHPGRIAYDLDGDCWVANRESIPGVVTYIKADTRKLTSTSNGTNKLSFASEEATRNFTLPGQTRPRLILFDENGHLWIGGTDQNFVQEYELSADKTQLIPRKKIVLPSPYSGAYVGCFGSDGNIYIACVNRSIFARVNIAGHDEAPDTTPFYGEIIKSGISGHYAVYADWYSNEILWSGYPGTLIYIYDIATNTFRTVDIGSGTFTGMGSDEDYYYLAARTPDCVVKVRKSDGQVVGRFPSSGTPHGIFCYEDRLFVVCPTSDDVKIYKTDGTFIKSVAVGTTPYVYGGFVTVQRTPGEFAIKSLYHDDPVHTFTGDEPGKAGYTYKVYDDATGDIIMVGTSGSDGMVTFYEPKPDGTPDTTKPLGQNPPLYQGNYTIKMSPIANEDIIFAGVAEGGYMDELDESYTFHVSMRDRINLELNVGNVNVNYDLGIEISAKKVADTKHTETYVPGETTANYNDVVTFEALITNYGNLATDPSKIRLDLPEGLELLPAASYPGVTITPVAGTTNSYIYSNPSLTVAPDGGTITVDIPLKVNTIETEEKLWLTATITELTVHRSPTVHPADINPSNNIDSTDLDIYNPPLVLVKKDLDNDNLLRGAYISVYGTADVYGAASTTPLYTGVSNGQGILTIERLYPDTYTVVETKAPDGFCKPDAPWTIVKDQDCDIDKETTTLYNKPTEVTFTKYQADTDITVAGAYLTVRDPSMKAMASGVTGADGTLTIKYLKWGSYNFIETKAPVGYLRNTKSYEFMIAENGVVSGTTDIYNKPITSNEIKRYPVDIWNKDENTLEPLTGAYAKVFTVSGELVGEGQFDDDGMIHVEGLLPGDYYAVALTAPDGYLINSRPVLFTIQKLGDVDGETVILMRPWEIMLLKTDEETGAPLGGAKIRLMKANGDTLCEGITDDYGRLFIMGLGEGDYTFKEVEAPAGYLLNTDTYSFSIGHQGKVTGTTTITNRRPKPVLVYSTIEILKVDAADKMPLGSARFGLYDVEGNLLAEAVSGEDGLVVFDGLSYGNYLVKELEAPKGYILPDNIIEVEIDVGYETTRYVVENMKPVKTGYGGLPIWLIVIALLALAGIVVSYVVSKKRNKK